MIQETPTQNPTPVPTERGFGPLKERIKKAYSQIPLLATPYKKLIKAFLIVLGLLLATTLVLAGFSLLSRRGEERVTSSISTPAPSAASEDKEADENEVRLEALKDRVFKLDLYQGHLSPPVLRFDSSF